MSSNLYTRIATEAFPTGAWLYCTEPGCDRGERATVKDCARYLARGWPEHHGRTMSAEKEKRG